MRRSVRPPLAGLTTGVAARLELAGYPCRQPDPDDGRWELLRPAPAGIAEASPGRRATRQCWSQGFDTAQFEAIVMTDDEQLTTLLERMCQA